jgi:hypothetical protein
MSPLKHAPAPLIDEIGPGQDGDAIERGLEQQRECRVARRHLVDEADLLE